MNYNNFNNNDDFSSILPSYHMDQEFFSKGSPSIDMPPTYTPTSNEPDCFSLGRSISIRSNISSTATSTSDAASIRSPFAFYNRSARNSTDISSTIGTSSNSSSYSGPLLNSMDMNVITENAECTEKRIIVVDEKVSISINIQSQKEFFTNEEVVQGYMTISNESKSDSKKFDKFLVCLKGTYTQFDKFDNSIKVKEEFLSILDYNSSWSSNRAINENITRFDNSFPQVQAQNTNSSAGSSRYAKGMRECVNLPMNNILKPRTTYIKKFKFVLPKYLANEDFIYNQLPPSYKSKKNDITYSIDARFLTANKVTKSETLSFQFRPKCTEEGDENSLNNEKLSFFDRANSADQFKSFLSILDQEIGLVERYATKYRRPPKLKDKFDLDEEECFSDSEKLIQLYHKSSSDAQQYNYHYKDYLMEKDPEPENPVTFESKFDGVMKNNKKKRKKGFFGMSTPPNNEQYNFEEIRIQFLGNIKKGIFYNSHHSNAFSLAFKIKGNLKPKIDFRKIKFKTSLRELNFQSPHKTPLKLSQYFLLFKNVDSEINFGSNLDAIITRFQKISSLVNLLGTQLGNSLFDSDFEEVLKSLQIDYKGLLSLNKLNLTDETVSDLTFDTYFDIEPPPFSMEDTGWKFNKSESFWEYRLSVSFKERFKEILEPLDQFQFKFFGSLFYLNISIVDEIDDNLKAIKDLKIPINF